MASHPESLATRLRQSRLARRDDVAPTRAATWDLIKVALLVPALTVVVLTVVVSLVKAIAGGAVSGLPSQVAAGWLVVNQVPLTVGDTIVGALPLLPTLLLIAAVAAVTARAARETDSLAAVGTIAGAALGGSLLTTALSLAVVADGSSVSSLGQPDPLTAFGATLLVQGIGVLIGVGRRCLAPLFAQYEFPATDRVGARAGLIAFAALVAGSGILVLAGELAHWSLIGELIEGGHSVDGYLGLVGLSILYLPNVLVAALGVSVGAEVNVGTASLTAFGTDPGTLPPLPVLGVMPEHLGAVGFAVLLIPLLTGVLIGWYCRSVEIVKHLRAVAVAAAAAAGLVAVASVLAGGRVGEIGSLGASAPVAAGYTFAWIMVVGAACAGVHYLLPSTRSQRIADAVPFDLDELLADEDFDGLEIVDDPDADGGDEAVTEGDEADPDLVATDVLEPLDDDEADGPADHLADDYLADDDLPGSGDTADQRPGDPVSSRGADGD
ncbi:DUF6350 family protein [Gordonia sp. VNK21]|uniref:cell division protein PerM n=1 Tax=Gordonia sp. VNK21 TaxID=3382483 RepID=UPI0038D4C6E6